jgi:hypothetical protein
MLARLVMWVRPSRLVPFALLVVAVSGCKKKVEPEATTRPVSSASAALSALPPPPASVADVADAAPEEAGVTSERSISAGATPAGYYLTPFVVKSIVESPGLAFEKAVEACALAGRFLCSETEWQLACGAAPELGKTEAWTYTAERERSIVRGGDGTCEKRAAVGASETNATRATLCCDRGVAVQTADGEIAKKIGTSLVVYERGLRERKLEDIALVTLETLVYAGKEMKREEVLPAALAAVLPDAAVEPVLLDACVVKPGLADAGASTELECRATRLRAAGPEELRWRFAVAGADPKLSRIDAPERLAPSEQKQRVGGFLPSAK